MTVLVETDADIKASLFVDDDIATLLGLRNWQSVTQEQFGAILWLQGDPCLKTGPTLIRSLPTANNSIG